MKIRKPVKNCGNCMACTQTCAMGIDMKKSDLVSSGECINCFQCISDCPSKNISIAVSERICAL